MSAPERRALWVVTQKVCILPNGRGGFIRIENASEPSIRIEPASDLIALERDHPSRKFTR
jgi:hypothetical protein